MQTFSTPILTTEATDLVIRAIRRDTPGRDQIELVRSHTLRGGATLWLDRPAFNHEQEYQVLMRENFHDMIAFLFETDIERIKVEQDRWNRWGMSPLHHYFNAFKAHQYQLWYGTAEHGDLCYFHKGVKDRQGRMIHVAQYLPNCYPHTQCWLPLGGDTGHPLKQEINLVALHGVKISSRLVGDIGGSAHDVLRLLSVQNEIETARANGTLGARLSNPTNGLMAHLLPA